MNDDKNKTETSVIIPAYYARARDIADGELVDATAAAREIGIVYPTAFTAAAFEESVRVPEGADVWDEVSTVWDVLWRVRLSLDHGLERRTAFLFEMYVRNGKQAPDHLALKAVCEQGDDLEPVVTIMLPGED